MYFLTGIGIKLTPTLVGRDMVTVLLFVEVLLEYVAPWCLIVKVLLDTVWVSNTMAT